MKALWILVFIGTVVLADEQGTNDRVLTTEEKQAQLGLINRKDRSLSEKFEPLQEATHQQGIHGRTKRREGTRGRGTDTGEHAHIDIHNVDKRDVVSMRRHNPSDLNFPYRHFKRQTDQRKQGVLAGQGQGIDQGQIQTHGEKQVSKREDPPDVFQGSRGLVKRQNPDNFQIADDVEKRKKKDITGGPSTDRKRQITEGHPDVSGNVEYDGRAVRDGQHAKVAPSSGGVRIHRVARDNEHVEEHAGIDESRYHREAATLEEFNGRQFEDHKQVKRHVKVAPSSGGVRIHKREGGHLVVPGSGDTGVAEFRQARDLNDEPGEDLVAPKESHMKPKMAEDGQNRQKRENKHDIIKGGYSRDQREALNEISQLGDNVWLAEHPEDARHARNVGQDPVGFQARPHRYRREEATLEEMNGGSRKRKGISD